MALLGAVTQQAIAEEMMKLTEIMYQEASPGVGTYPYRILVNDEYLRFDGGKDEDGYILFNRKEKQVVSVNHEDQSLFYIQPQSKKTYENSKIEVVVIESNLEKAPKIQNFKAKLYDIVANESLCRQVLSFDGLLPEVTKAWKEFEELMQIQNQLTLSRTPKDMQTDCFIANNISNASEFLNYGLPYSIKSKDGTLRILKDYSVVEKPLAIMGVPVGYQKFGL